MALSSTPIQVLVVPADRSKPLQHCRLAPSRFHQVLGGEPLAVVPLVTQAPPTEWQLFLQRHVRSTAGVANLRAQSLSTRLSGQPGRTLPGDVIFAGWVAGGLIRPVPGLIPTMARQLGFPVQGG